MKYEGTVNLSENRWKRLPLVALSRHAYPTCGSGISEIIVKLTIPWSYLKVGVMIDTDQAGLIHYPEADSDLELIERTAR